MSESQLLVERSADVLRVTINRPEKRNALSLGLLDQIGAAFAAHRAEPLKLAVLTSAGDKAFAAGGDLQELDALRAPAQARAMAERAHAVLDQIRYFPVPVLGALNGVALGGGAELAMACDLRIATARADLGLIQARLAVTTAWGGGIDLLDAVGSSRALAILATGERLTPDAALALGLYAAVCEPDGDFAAFTSAFIESYLDKSLHVLRGYKATSAARRRQLHNELTETARDAFVTAWVDEAHWTAAAGALKKR